MGFRTEGADDLDRVARALKDAADKDLQKRVSAAMREVARPIGRQVLEEGARALPSRGGFASYVEEKGRVLVSNSLRGRVASVEVILRNKGVQFKAIDAGRLRHPVFARGTQARNDWPWVTQAIRPGAFSRPFEEKAATARGEIIEAAQGVLDQVARKA